MRASKQDNSEDRVVLGEIKAAANSSVDSTIPINSVSPTSPPNPISPASPVNLTNQVDPADTTSLNSCSLDDKMESSFLNTMRRLRRIKFSTSVSPEGVTPAESRVVHMVMHMESRGAIARPSAVAARMHTTPSALSQILKTLEKKGLIARYRAHDDFRAVTLELTDEGRAVARESEQLYVEHTKAVIAYVGEEDFAHLLRTVDKILEYHELHGLGQPDGDDFSLEDKDQTCGDSLKTMDGSAACDVHNTSDGSACCGSFGSTTGFSCDNASCSDHSSEGGSSCVLSAI